MWILILLKIHCLFIVFFVKKYFYCGRKYNIGDDNIKVHACTKCNKSWCYILPKSKKDCDGDSCDDYKLDMSTPSLLPIHTQYDPVIVTKLHSVLPSLFTLDFEGGNAT